jgi:N-acyl-D-amino-acid deacylase
VDKKNYDFLNVEYDYVIGNGTVIDPKSETRTIANVGIKGDKVAVVRRAGLKGRKQVDATGKIVCPGFVDPHSHADGQLFSAQVMASMGVTTIIIGSCGVGPYPTQKFLKELYETVILSIAER